MTDLPYLALIGQKFRTGFHFTEAGRKIKLEQEAEKHRAIAEEKRRRKLEKGAKR